MFRPAYLIRCVNCSKIKNFLSRSVLLMQPTPLCFTQYCRSHLLLKQGKQLRSLLVMKFCSICRHLSSTQPPTSQSLNIHCRYCQTAFAMRPSLSEMYYRDLCCFYEAGRCFVVGLSFSPISEITPFAIGFDIRLNQIKHLQPDLASQNGTAVMDLVIYWCGNIFSVRHSNILKSLMLN